MIKTGCIDPIRMENLMNPDKVMAALNEMAAEDAIATEDLVKGFYEQVSALNQTMSVLRSEGFVVGLVIVSSEKRFGATEGLEAQVFEPL
jgi:hypothetical protein